MSGKKEVTPTQKALNLWAIILIIWSFYRSYLVMPVWFDEFIAKPLVFVLPVIYFLRKSDKKDLKGIIDYLYLKLKTKEIIKDILGGLGIGLVFYATSLLASFYRTGKLIYFQKPVHVNDLIYIVFIALATGITEEILSRGFVLRKLYDESKNAISATFFSAVLFFFLHIPILFTNSKISGNMLLMFMATDMMLSMVNGLLFLDRKSLTLPIFIHTFYNVVIALTIL